MGSDVQDRLVGDVGGRGLWPPCCLLSDYKSTEKGIYNCILYGLGRFHYDGFKCGLLVIYFKIVPYNSDTK